MKLGSLLTGSAGRSPNRLAVICGDQRITFAQLEETANRLANHLLDAGITSGDRVAVFMANCVELIEALAGVTKTGALITPISTRLLEKEVAYILDHAEPAAIFYPATHREIVSRSLAGRPEILKICLGETLDGEQDFHAFAVDGAPEPPPSLSPMPDDCVLGYTSGTTGLPKGAVGTHTNLISIGGLICSQEWALTPDDVIMATTPMAHRTGLARLANSFQLGCPLVMQPKFDAEDALDVIEREGVTVMGGVPTIVRMMMGAIEKRPTALAKLRLIVTTGEVFPEPLKKRLYAAVPHVGLYTYLAQTEAGVVCGMRPGDHARKPGAMGFPIPGVEVRLVDSDMKDVPSGEAGEILVKCGSPGQFITMREYFRDPEATKAAFVDDWFRTGDLAYADEDGFLYFADRAKDMIVSGGLNIYSREVELTLQDHPSVVDAAVFGVPDDDFGEAVFACIEVQQGTTPSAAELIEHCRAHMASYKKPKYFEFMDNMPRTSAGKIQKHELKSRIRAAR